MLKTLRQKGKLLTLTASCLMMLGCSTTVPLSKKFPEAPQVLMEPAPALKPLASDKKTLTDLLVNANENYGLYYELLDRYNAWQQWYKQQKEIFDSVK